MKVPDVPSMVTKWVIRPRGLPPDLIGGAAIMSLPVGVVRILVGVEILVGICGNDLARLDDRAIGPLARIGIDNFSAVGFENPSCARSRHSKACKASRRNRRLRPASRRRCRCFRWWNPAAACRRQSSAAERLLHDAGRGAVLHRSAGIHPLGLGVDLGIGHIGANTLKPQERCVAYALDNRESRRRNR